MSSRLKIFFDGGCRPNPGMMETAVVVRGIAHIARDQGHGSNLDAEWLALIHALRLAQSLGETDVILVGDSVTVVGQANGRLKCRGGSAEHLQAFRSLTSGATPPPVRHIKRSQNLAGIALARLHGR